MKVIKVKNYDEMSDLAAKMVAEQIKEKPNSVLGFATGGTPEGMYNKLQGYNLDWSKIKSFNLDEYIGVDESLSFSYHSYMNEKLFNKINIKRENIHIPSGQGNIKTNGENYDKKINSCGGIDLQILGIGENAHIAFNEPGSSFEAGTREVHLTDSTIKANSRYFSSPDDVPKTAISMGIGQIVKAKKIILLASGIKKAQAIKDTVEGKITESIPSSILQEHKNTILIIDEDAASLLK